MFPSVKKSSYRILKTTQVQILDFDRNLGKIEEVEDFLINKGSQAWIDYEDSVMCRMCKAAQAKEEDFEFMICTNAVYNFSRLLPLWVIYGEAAGDALFGFTAQLNEKIGESEKRSLSWFTQAWFGELVFVTNEHYNGKE